MSFEFYLDQHFFEFAMLTISDVTREFSKNRFRQSKKKSLSFNLFTRTRIN